MRLIHHAACLCGVLFTCSVPCLSPAHPPFGANASSAPATDRPQTAEGAPSWASVGDAVEDGLYGASVSSAGDVNGDGFADLLIGAYGAFSTGQAYVYHGSATGPGLTPAWVAAGDNQHLSYFGAIVSSAGDVNGDGFDDVVIGAPGFTLSTGGAKQWPREGKAYLYLGSPTGLATDPAWTSMGDASEEAGFGWTVSSAGDINDDGYADVIVGAPYLRIMQAWPCCPKVGKAYLFHGSPTGLSSAPDWTLLGQAYYSEFAYSVSSARDVNGDGYDDVIIGDPDYNAPASDEGKAWLFLGSAAGLANSPAWSSSGDARRLAQFGASASSAGDVNGDGYSDICIGAPHDEKVYVFHGSAQGLSQVASWTSSGQTPHGGYFGCSVSSLGDVNGDGYSDLVVGASYYSTLSEHTGKAYLFSGSAAGLSRTARWTSVGDDYPQASFGSSVSAAGDIDGDGFDDIIIGAPNWGASGKAFLYVGSSNVLPDVDALGQTPLLLLALSASGFALAHRLGSRRFGLTSVCSRRGVKGVAVWGVGGVDSADPFG